MQFAAVFVEYLVTGCGGLAWLALWAGVTAQQLISFPGDRLGLWALPLIYLLGMFIDAIMSIGLRPVKLIVRGDAASTRLARQDASLAWLMLLSSDLGREYQSRSSRDRIARGTVFNVAAFGTIATWSPDRLGALLGYAPFSRGWVGLTAVLVTALAFALWWHFEYYTHAFKLQALRALERRSSKGDDTLTPGDGRLAAQALSASSHLADPPSTSS